jgi:integrase
MTRRSFGSVRQLPSRKWQARYPTPDGKLRAAPQLFLTRVKASAFLADVEAQQNKGVWIDPRSQTETLRAFAGLWLEQRKIAPRTRELYGDLLRLHILPTLGDMRIGGITPVAVRNWHHATSERTGPTRTRQAYALLRAILNTAVDDEILHRNPCRIPGAGQMNHPERPLLSLAQVDRLLDALDENMRVPVLIAFWAHLRLGELVALQRQDFDLESGVLHVRRQIVRTRRGPLETEPKAASRRSVHLPDEAIKALGEHLSNAEPSLPSAWLFTWKNGVPLRHHHVQNAWYAARLVAVLPHARFHDLRHAGLTLAALGGTPLKDLMVRAGHSTMRAAMIYQHSAADSDRAIAARMSNLRVLASNQALLAEGQSAASGT